MMRRRLNFTNRRKIEREHVAILLIERDGHLKFTAELRLGEYELDPLGRVYIEAYRGSSTTLKRFDFGTVEAPAPQGDCLLDEFGHAQGILFRVKVTSRDASLGQLLAKAERIHPRLPDDDSRGLPLISVDEARLDGEIWRLDFSDKAPVLLIDERIPGTRLLAGDPHFRALTAPTILRQILTRILAIDGDIGDDDDEDDPRGRWVRFGERLPGVGECPGPLGIGESFAGSSLELWIDEAVRAFAQRRRLFDQFLKIHQAPEGKS